MATQFDLYNGALRLLQHRRLAAVTDTNPERYHLDDAYTGAKAYMLEQGQWAFASVSTSISGTASSNRGFSYRFTKPADFVRLISISASSSYYPPMEDYAEDSTYWFSNETTIYVTYVSKYSASATVTMTIAAPGVVTWTNHELVANDPVVFTTTGALPTGVTSGTTYYVSSTDITANTFKFAATPGGSVITTSGSQSGTHTGQCISGGNLSKWPETYAKAVEGYLALEVGPHLSKGADLLARVGDAYASALQLSLAKDTINRTSRIVSSATREIYNGALRLLGRRLISNFDDKVIGQRIYDASGSSGNKQQQGQAPSLPAYDIELESILRRLLDESYDSAVAFMLGEGLWNFASRTVAIEAETDVEPEFGYQYTFEKPSDFVRLVAISDTGMMWPTLGSDQEPAYMEEAGYYHANTNPLYVQYISNGASYGLNTSLWPLSFKKALEAYLAKEIAPHARVSRGMIQDVEQKFIVLLRNARTKDAMDQASVRPPPGRLARSRSGMWRNVQRREN